MSAFFATSQKGRIPSWSPELEAEILDDLVDHFWEEFPREACGVITEDGEVIRFQNRSRQPDQFRVGSIQVIRRLGWKGYLRGEGVQLIYHSHRQSTNPSQTDELFMQHMARVWPAVDHLIFTHRRLYDVWTVGQ